MNAPTIHCPECSGILIKDVVFTGIVDLSKSCVRWTQKCAQCKAMVQVEIVPTIRATGNGMPATVGERNEPRIRTFSS